MAFSVENSHNSYIYINRKRCFLLLLLLNCLLACIYYIHVQKQSKTTQHLTTYTKQIPKNLYSKQPITKAMKFIRKILENEYDLNDLITFYNIVEKEFSLGLRCTRKSKKPTPTTTTTTTTTILTNSSKENSTDITTIR